jgi:hypothetical protein
MEPSRRSTVPRRAPPKSASWIIAVEGFSSAIIRRRIWRDHCGVARPFAWTKPTDIILGKFASLPTPFLGSVHYEPDLAPLAFANDYQ